MVAGRAVDSCPGAVPHSGERGPLARISFLHRRDGRSCLQARMPVTTGGISGSRMFRSALGTSALRRAKRCVCLCMSWIVDVKDRPEIASRGASLLRRISIELERGFLLDADVLAARATLEHYVRGEADRAPGRRPRSGQGLSRLHRKMEAVRRRKSDRRKGASGEIDRRRIQVGLRRLLAARLQ